jgi:hypothetical protein
MLQFELFFKAAGREKSEILQDIIEARVKFAE